MIKGDISKIDDQIWPVFELVQNFFCVHLISKFQEDPIKGFFSNQADVTLRLIIKSGQFSNLSKISPYLQVSVTSNQN